MKKKISKKENKINQKTKQNKKRMQSILDFNQLFKYVTNKKNTTCFYIDVYQDSDYLKQVAKIYFKNKSKIFFILSTLNPFSLICKDVFDFVIEMDNNISTTTDGKNKIKNILIQKTSQNNFKVIITQCDKKVFCFDNVKLSIL